MASASVNRANRRRGEVEAMIDGERRILCLTLGALAELETAFAADGLADLAARFSTGRLRARDLIRILGAGLRGGGNRLADEDVADMAVDGGLEATAALVRDLLTVTFGGAGDTGPGGGTDGGAQGGEGLAGRSRQDRAPGGPAPNP